jgi:hypothetical protein
VKLGALRPISQLDAFARVSRRPIGLLVKQVDEVDLRMALTPYFPKGTISGRESKFVRQEQAVQYMCFV